MRKGAPRHSWHKSLETTTLAPCRLPAAADSWQPHPQLLPELEYLSLGSGGLCRSCRQPLSLACSTVEDGLAVCRPSKVLST